MITELVHTQLLPELLPAATLLLSVNKMIWKERLACGWLALNLTKPVVFTERLAGAFWDRKKWGGGREKTCKPGRVLPNPCRGIMCASRPWHIFGSGPMTLLPAQQEAEGQ